MWPVAIKYSLTQLLVLEVKVVHQQLVGGLFLVVVKFPMVACVFHDDDG